MEFTFDYDKMILLDAEDLAEGGIKNAYESILSILRRYVPEPAQVWESVDNEKPLYVVRRSNREYTIYSPELSDERGESWARATHAFFRIVNDQLANSERLLYAINGGNDLGGMFLTLSECSEARDSLKYEKDWPYLPTLEPPWYGQYRS